MMRAAFLVLAVIGAAGSAYAQQSVVVHIRAVLIDADQKPVPASHHALLISEDPPSEPPRRVVTAADGTVDVRLRPGNYTVESERPIAFQGRAYQWTRRIAVSAGRDVSLELTAQNAEETASPSGSSLEIDPSFLLHRWERSVVGVWTPLVHRAGFVVDAANGLVITNARLAAPAPDVEVQLTTDIKVRARIVAADPENEVAVLQIQPSVTGSILPLRPDCAPTSTSPIAPPQELVTIAAPLRGPNDLVTGTVVRVGARAIDSDLRLPPASAGSPVFAAGRLVGMTSAVAARADDDSRRWASRVVGIDPLCAVLASAEKNLRDGVPPDATRLPVDPAQSAPAKALEAIVARRAGSLSPAQISATDFDVAFITPVQAFAAQSSSFTGARQRSGPGLVDVGSRALAPVRDFANWSDYVADAPPVLLVRATPKLVEGFWTTVGRGAAQTQGIALPSVKRVKAGFARMRAFCGDVEVTPIHPFTLEQRVSESEVIYEGLYAFDPDALGPQCAAVKLTLYSDKQPGKGDTRQIDPKIIQGISDDMAAYRAAAVAQVPR